MKHREVVIFDGPSVTYEEIQEAYMDTGMSRDTVFRYDVEEGAIIAIWTAD